MKPFTSALLALASACLAAGELRAARPQYGGTLRAAIEGTIRSTPAATASDIDALAQERVLPLVFESLTRVDADAGLQPMLALAWSRDATGSRWTFQLRPGVALHDGTVLEAWQAAASLRAAENRWRVAAEADTLIIDTPEPAPDLPWRLADAAHAIGVRPSADRWLGTGPFRIDRLDASSLTLRAHDAYWNGRPFLDAIEIQMGRAPAAQLADLEAGRLDLASLQPTDARRMTQRGLTTASSQPIELVAVLFEPHRNGDRPMPMRRAVARAVDRSTLSGVLLQRQAEPAFGLLPGWLSGFTLTTEDLPPAGAPLPQDQREVVVRVEPGDALAQSIAERMAVDARAQGVTIKVQIPTGLAPRADARIVRVRLRPMTPERAIAQALQILGGRSAAAGQLPETGAVLSLDDVRRVERLMADRAMVVPIVHLRDVYALAARVSSWRGAPIDGAGAWNLGDVWVRDARP